ncbi:MAG TPA: DUF4129 domain-containing protein [Longimicrobium sp.]|jgi:hypothetical protein
MQLPSAQEVDRALREVYAQPEFVAHKKPPGLMDLIREQIGRAFAWIINRLSGIAAVENAGPVVFYIMVALLAAAAIGLLAHLFYTSGIAFTRERGAGPADDGESLRGPRTAADWEGAARRAASEGRLRDASLALYNALVLRLDARGALRFDPAKTPGDYRREVRANPEVARPFAAFVRGFEPVVFGGRALDPDGYERLRAAAGEAGARG